MSPASRNTVDRNPLSGIEQVAFNTGLNALLTADKVAQALPSAPTLLTGRSAAWIVASGSIDIFAVPLDNGQPAGARTHVCRIEANQAVFGDGSAHVHLFNQGLLAVPLPNTHWVQINNARVVLQAASNDGLVLRCLADIWLQAFELELHPQHLAERMAASSALVQLDAFHAAVLQRLHEQRGALDASDRALIHTRQTSEAQTFGYAIGELAKVVTARQKVAAAGRTGDALVDACQQVLNALGFKSQLVKPSATVLAAAADMTEIVEAMCRQAKVSQRRVSLEGSAWWKDVSAPLLAFKNDTAAPVALIPKASGGYVMVDPVTGQETPLNAATATGIGPMALMFYRAFDNEVITVKKLVLFGLQGTTVDLWRVLIFGVLGGLLGLLTPTATGLLIDGVIPSANANQLLQMVMLLTTASISIAAFELARGLAIFRIESRIDNTNQAAVIDRLLNLPVPFFRDFAAGDLAQRALGIDAILYMLTSTVQAAIFGWLFGLFSFVYLFFIDIKLAFLAIALVLVSLLITTAVNFYRLRLERQTYQVQGDIASLVFQILSGIAKLRGGGAEKRAFARWAEAFTKQKTLDFKIRSLANGMAVFDSGYIVLCSLLLFLVVAFYTTGISTGSFMAFNSAFGQFMAATLGMTSALTAALNVVPLYERAKPILTTLPEVNDQRAAPGQLVGAIELSGIHFRYAPDAPMVLTDVNIRIEPGEFVAFVGPSGCGKSTLFRLLLGFEKPLSGGVFYDGQDLAGLDVQAVRRQLGVVLQNGKLMPGDIFTNIVGSSPLSHADAMQAMVMAGMEGDLKDMPMGLYTVISEGAGTISGGQKQRLMVARAIVKKPRILLFDEATSALDNRTQSIVANSVSQLKATRVVIAHRLSTVVEADRIFVIDAGRVVETGTYTELMQLNGQFAELARRQLA